MKKYIIIIITLWSLLIISPYTCNVFAAEIPQELEEVKYFLQVINTPFWIWFFRTAFCVFILGILISFFYYQKKKD